VVDLESIEELIFIMMSLVFLLMGVMLVASILMSAYNPYDQITFANTEKLRSAMNEACFLNAGNDNPVKVSFDMPQNIPILSGVFTILPAWVMRSGGDPNYVLYYESFPPGEAIGWEVHHSTFKDRLVTYLPSRSAWEGKTEREVLNYVYDIFKDSGGTSTNKDIDAIVVGNIILDDKYRSDFVVNKQDQPDLTLPADGYFIRDYTRTDDTKKGFFGYGAWGGNSYKFHNYLGLTPLEKTLVKYQACGDDTLCLKTRDGVYKFPLGNCNDVDYIQLVYDSRAKISNIGKFLGANVVAGLSAVVAIFSPIGKLLGIGSFAFNANKAFEAKIALLLSFKASDFYVASPCSIKEVEVSVTNCGSSSIYVCENMAEYPLFEYDEDGKLKYVGEHYFCLDSVIGNTYNSANKPDKCLIVKISDQPDGFCWTPDPLNPIALSKPTSDSWFSKFRNFFLNFFTTKDALSLKVYPVVLSRVYVKSTDSFVLTPPSDIADGLKVFGLIKSSKSWGWP